MITAKMTHVLFGKQVFTLHSFRHLFQVAQRFAKSHIMSNIAFKISQ
jgi:hypothetical protein